MEEVSSVHWVAQVDEPFELVKQSASTSCIKQQQMVQIMECVKLLKKSTDTVSYRPRTSCNIWLLQRRRITAHSKRSGDGILLPGSLDHRQPIHGPNQFIGAHSETCTCML